MVIVIKKSEKKKDIEKKIRASLQTKSEKLFKASKYCGKVKFNMDALSIQKKLRNEWDKINALP